MAKLKITQTKSGIGYKRNLEALRESPGLRLMEMLEARGAAACYFDPLVPVIPLS